VLRAAAGVHEMVVEALLVTVCGETAFRLWATAYTRQPGAQEGGGGVVALRRQNQVRQLEDTWPIGLLYL
jgi:hypothetical protein